jgi:pimeloyl-ACP methyl ester carboxylesterase
MRSDPTVDGMEADRSGMAHIDANGITIEYDTLGPTSGEPLLLIAGLGMQLIRWSGPFRELLVGRGFRVIRFDNRDAGLSTHFNGAPVADLEEVAAARFRGERPDVPYDLDDMARDTVGLLDALGIERAHIVGASMGGMIAQLVAADHAHRVHSLTLIMSTTGNPDLPPATPEAMAALMGRPPHPSDEEAYLAHAARAVRAIGSPAYPAVEAELRARLLEAVRRNYDPAGSGRQMAAVAATGDRRERLRRITAPTLVVHGADDPLIRIEAAYDTAAHIAGAELMVIPGMGHDLPPALHPRIVAAIAAVAAQARSAPDLGGGMR